MSKRSGISSTLTHLKFESPLLEASAAAARQTDLVFRYRFDDDSRCQEASGFGTLSVVFVGSLT